MQRLAILIVILLTYTLKVFSCDCDGDYLYDSEFYYCDVVLSGKIVSVFAQTQDSYKIKLEIKNVFKGPSISEFEIGSTPENFEVIENGDTLIYMTSCDIYLREGEEWLIYADKYCDNEYGFSFCSATKILNRVSNEELSFLNYQQSLVISESTVFFDSDELENPDLVSLSVRGYPLIYSKFITKTVKKGNLSMTLRIDKNGMIVRDGGMNEEENNIIDELKGFEPFIPGIVKGEIVNSEHTVIVTSKNPQPPRPLIDIIDSSFMGKETKQELKIKLRD